MRLCAGTTKEEKGAGELSWPINVFQLGISMQFLALSFIQYLELVLSTRL
jgi:hypothetical protein